MLSDGLAVTVGRAWPPPYVRWSLIPGADLPLAVDPGRPDRVDVDWAALAAERPGGHWRDVPSPDGVLAPPTDAAPEPTVSAEPSGGVPADATLDTVEGVTMSDYAAIEAALIHHRVPPGQYDAFVSGQHGLPPGRWAAVTSGWQSRIRSDWQVGAAYGAAFEHARKELKRRR